MPKQINSYEAERIRREDPTLLASSPRLRAALWLAILAVAAIRFFGPIRYDPHAAVLKGPEAVRVAYSLYKYGDWINPYGALPTGPTAHEAPLFPALLAGLYKIFGEGAKGAYAVQYLEALALTGQVMMIPLVARALGADPVTGFIAAISAILGLRRSYAWEQNYVGFLLVLATLLACTYLRTLRTPTETKERHPANLSTKLSSPVVLSTALGLLWGAILLTSPTPALVWVAWVALGGWWSLQRGVRKAWLPVLIVPVLMGIPWAWRNYRVLHSPVLVRSDLGIELMVSNNSCARFGVVENQFNRCFWPLHPNTSPAEAQKVIDLGEVNYSRAKLRQAVTWIRDNPWSFSRLTLERFLYFWFPTDTGRFADALFGYHRDQNTIPAWAIYVATLLSIPGLVILWRTSRHAAVICLSFLVLYPPIYYVVQFDERYRLPILWVTFVLGAVAARAAPFSAIGRLRRSE